MATSSEANVDQAKEVPRNFYTHRVNISAEPFPFSQEKPLLDCEKEYYLVQDDIQRWLDSLKKDHEQIRVILNRDGIRDIVNLAFRELIFNALDSIREKRFLDKKKGTISSYGIQIVIGINESNFSLEIRDTGMGFIDQEKVYDQIRRNRRILSKKETHREEIGLKGRNGDALCYLYRDVHELGGMLEIQPVDSRFPQEGYMTAVRISFPANSYYPPRRL